MNVYKNVETGFNYARRVKNVLSDTFARSVIFTRE